MHLSNKVYFLYPFEGPSTSIVLRQPLFGDSENVNFQTQVRHSRSGNVYAYKRTPSYQVLKLVFEHLRETAENGFSSKTQVRAFLDLSASKKIIYLDHKNQRWAGLIISPTVEFVNQGKDQTGDLYGMTLEFEGALI